LDSEIEDRFLRHPSEIHAMVKALPEEIPFVVLDEIQKVPKLLDEVHRLIEEKTDKLFILTGSSARKLKHGGANLLAGRAFVYHLFTLSCFELKEQFDLERALHWGTLPKIFSLDGDLEKSAFLRAYADTYLKEEIWNEQVVRKLQPFRRFLEVAAQCNGKIINYANIAEDVGVNDKTIKEYFCILEDTMIGFFLEPFHNSFRKRLVEKPKFYFFDTGIVRSLSRRLSIPLTSQTSAYGDAFEHFIILEFIRLASYFQPDYRFSFIRTASDVEVDLVVERPGKPLLCIEIKSSNTINESSVSAFSRLTKDLLNCEAIVLSQDRFMKKYDHVTCYPWKQGIAELFPEITSTSERSDNDGPL
jgi:predicted AAA+ superfamily ATPase